MPTETLAKPTKKVAAKKVPTPKKRTNEDTVTALTIAGAEHEPANRPSSFEALRLNDLQAAANAFGVDWADKNEEEIREALAEDYITWNMYVKQFKLPGWQELPDEDVDFPEPLEDWDEAEDEEVDELSQDVITAKPFALAPEGKYLIKFVGQNTYFERDKFKFSKEKPYALMNARDAQAALVEEPTKFRQAMPDELESFYA